MKHFTIQTPEQAKALRPYALARPKIGHIVHPSAGQVVNTAWEEYPEADALTFEQCMDVVKDVVTEEEWTPKAGEMVEVSGEDGHWYSAEYIGLSRDKHIVWTGGWTGAVLTEWPNCRPLRPAITRAEAEAQLRKRIID